MSNFHLILKELRLKATPKRLAILDILVKELVYVTPEDVWKKMKERFKNIGLPTVYRNLEDLSNKGAIVKIIHPDRKLYYFYCRNTEHHHHFVCISCRRVEDISFCGFKDIEEEVEKTLKGRVVSHLLQVFGLCRMCYRAREASL